MRIVHTVEFILTLILRLIVLSLEFECLPNGAPIPGIPRTNLSASSFGIQHPPASSVPSASSVPCARTQSPLRSPPPVKETHDVRFRSASASNIDPPTRLTASDGHGYGLDQLQFIRLIPKKNLNQLLELRRYTFPVDERIKIRVGNNIFPPVPSQEQIVLSTHNGDVFGILTRDYTLSGIYRHNPGTAREGRVKVNVDTGTITPLEADEVDKIPVGPTRRILHDFRVVHLNQSD